MTDDKDITLWMNAHRLDALYNHGVDVENDLTEYLNSLYEQFVPAEERNKIEAQVQTDQDEYDRYHEQNRSFALLSITQNNESVCYEYDNCPSFLTAARWFVKALDDNKNKPFDDGYRSDMAYMTEYINRFESDPRITLCAQINHDKGFMCVWNGCWVEYSAERLIEAVRAADQIKNLTPEQREQIFESKLNEDNPEFHADEESGMEMQL